MRFLSVAGISVLLFSSQLSLAVCKLDPASIKVQWTGFKTIKKLGVNGVFSDVQITGGEGKDPTEALKSVRFVINGLKIDSGDPVRDAKISSIFFAQMHSGKISGKVKNIDNDNNVTIDLMMNGIEHPVALKLAVTGKKLIAKGSLDILDFSGTKALKSLNQACFDKHEGKTWNEAGIMVSVSCQ